MTTILVVDDEPSIVDTLREILTWEGYQVITADDGQEALEAMKTSAPDLVLVDYMMPLVDGVEVLRRMGSIAGCQDTRRILMSAVTEPPATKLWDVFIRKPFDVDGLLAAIARALASTR